MTNWLSSNPMGASRRSSSALKLPGLDLMARQPKTPHRKMILASCTLANGTVVRLARNHPGTLWWIDATLPGRGAAFSTKMTNTITTTSARRAVIWQKAVESCDVEIVD